MAFAASASLPRKSSVMPRCCQAPPTPHRTCNSRRDAPRKRRRMHARWERKGLEALDDRDVGRAAALAHRLQPIAAADALELVEHGGEQLGPGGAQGMAEGDRASVGVDLLGIGLDLLEPSQHNWRERLIDL